jgi:signal transduction histidine kinase|tara:strand:+ start:2415 stop:2684 length:270 start_codon:yes stop_codon:yes gene_type:complete
MAKTKKKAEKAKKITNDELNKVQSIINNINRAQLEIGSFESKKHNLLHHVTFMQEELSKLQIDFKKSYGTDDINIKDGTINYEKNEQTN